MIEILHTAHSQDNAITPTGVPGFTKGEVLSFLRAQAGESDFAHIKIAFETASKTDSCGWWKRHLQRPLAIEGNNYQAMHFLYVVSSACVWTFPYRALSSTSSEW